MRIWICLFALLFTTQAFAIDSYFGLSYAIAPNDAVCDQLPNIAQTDFGGNTDSEDCNEEADGKQLRIGYYLWSWLGLEVTHTSGMHFRGELNFEDTTQQHRAQVESELRGLSLAVLGQWDLSRRYALNAYIGLWDWSVDYTYKNTVNYLDASGAITNTDVSEVNQNGSDHSPYIGFGLLVNGDEGVSLLLKAEQYRDMPLALGVDETLTLYSIGFIARY